MSSPQHDRGDNVVPIRRDDTSPAEQVFDAEIVSEDEYQASKARAAIRRVQAHPIVTTARTVATHDRTRTAGKALLRHTLYVPAGMLVVGRRVWEAKTNSRYERMMRAAEAAGDYERVAEWEQRAQAAKKARHERAMDWLEAPTKFARAFAITLVSITVLLTAIGGIMYAATGDGSRFLAPFTTLFRLVNGIIIAITVAWGPLVLAAPWVAVLVFWWIGRRGGRVPTWVAPVQSTDGDPITPSKVVTALRDLGVSTLRNAIKDMGDAGAGMLGMIHLAGCGVEVDVTLPSGVSTNEVQTRRRKLAENLDRHEHEVFITIPDRPRTVRLWVANSGALDEPIGPSPLVIDPDMSADYYTGSAPWGQTLRGDLAAVALLQRHLLITGLSNQGKTAALRALVLWLLLDASVEVQVADLKGIGDWHMLGGVATTLIEGPSDDHCIAATEMLEWGVGEMERRLEALDADAYPDGVTRKLARSEQGFHPIVLLVDEAQQAFMCPVKDGEGNPYGGKSNRSRYFMAARKIHNQGRAVNVVLWQGTQDPTDQNLPKLVREGAHIRGSLVVGTEQQARMAIGDKAVNAGAAPHKLRQGLDKGTLVVTGDGVPVPTGEPAVTIRTHFIDGEAATQIAERVKGRRGVTRTATAVEPEERDLLADLDAVLTDDPVPSADVPALLHKHAPRCWPVGMTGKELRGMLLALGVHVPKTGNRFPMSRDTIRQALAQRGDDEQS